MMLWQAGRDSLTPTLAQKERAYRAYPVNPDSLRHCR